LGLKCHEQRHWLVPHQLEIRQSRIPENLIFYLELIKKVPKSHFTFASFFLTMASAKISSTISFGTFSPLKKRKKIRGLKINIDYAHQSSLPSH